MPLWTRTTVVPGDRVTVEIKHSTRSALRPLIGFLRMVKVLDHARAVILNEDGTRYTVHGRRLPPVPLVQVSIFTNPATGSLWAQVYELPPREHSPYPIPPRYAAIAQPDGHGGIAQLSTCWCGDGCVCSTCGASTVEVPTPRGLAWSIRSCCRGRHTPSACIPSSRSTPAVPATENGPGCCALPMRLAPIAWVCNREAAHQRPYLWPDHPIGNR